MTKIMGILNVTPDSFSDGGNYFTAGDAIRRFETMLSEGTDIIDIGAQSTRPEAVIVTPEEEWTRLEPVLQEIKRNNYNIQVSIDSFNPTTIRKCLEYDIDIINDVTGLASAEMVGLVIESGCRAVFMHSLSVPADKEKIIDENEDIIELLLNWGNKRLVELTNAGIRKEQLIFDPGIGFGKNPEHCLDIIYRAKEFLKLGVEVLIGHSEKSFLTVFTDKPAGQRQDDIGPLSYILAEQNIDYIRVHNVVENRKMVELAKNAV